MFHGAKLRWFVVSLILFAALQALAAEDTRDWTDTSGKFKIKGKFVSLDDGQVTIEQEDNRELQIPLKKLCAVDQKYVANATAKADDNPFKAKSDDSPFKTKEAGAAKSKARGRGKMASETAEPAGAGGAPVAVDWSQAASISLVAPGEAWSVAGPKEAATFTTKLKNCALPPKTGFFESLKGVAIGRGAAKAAVGFSVDEPKPVGVSRVVLCDLATGKTSPPASAPGIMAPLALHDDGAQILMKRDEFGFGNQDRLEVWTLKGPKVTKGASWIPYDDAQGAARDVLWAEFLDADRLATSSRAGKVVLWKFPEIEPICKFSLVDGAMPALSPDRKTIAYCNGKEIGIFDVDKQEVVAQQPTPGQLQWPSLAFSPSGKQLGCVAFDKVLMWDVASGELKSTIPCAGMPIHGQVDFPQDNFLLANGKLLFDLSHQLKLWTYDGGERARSVGGWTCFALSDGDKKPGVLLATQIPQAAAKQLLEKALSDSDLFVVKAGAKVKIDVSAVPAAEQERVKAALSKRLQAIGCVSDDAGTVRLIAMVDGPKERAISYMHSGDYKVQEYITKAQFVYNDQVAWEASSTNVPFFISLKKGENIGDHLKAREKPDFAFFDHVELPKFVQKPTPKQGATGSVTLGQSRVTITGLQ
jgi:hypothetical protein